VRSQVPVHAFHSRGAQGDDHGQGQDGLADGDAGQGEQQAHLSQWAPVGDKGVDHQTDEHRGQGQRRVHQQPYLTLGRKIENIPARIRKGRPLIRLAAMEPDRGPGLQRRRL
jgi:hypothetical protein